MRNQNNNIDVTNGNSTQEFITLLEADIQVREVSLNSLQAECETKDRTIAKLKNAVITLGVLFIGLGILCLITLGA